MAVINVLQHLSIQDNGTGQSEFIPTTYLCKNKPYLKAEDFAK